MIKISGISPPTADKAIKMLEKQEFIRIDKKTTPRESWITILDFEASKHEIDETKKRNAAQNLPVDRVAGPRDRIERRPYLKPESVQVFDKVVIEVRDSKGNLKKRG